jgi:ankyrin repeat protein
VINREKFMIRLIFLLSILLVAGCNKPNQLAIPIDKFGATEQDALEDCKLNFIDAIDRYQTYPQEQLLFNNCDQSELSNHQKLTLYSIAKTRGFESLAQSIKDNTEEMQSSMESIDKTVILAPDYYNEKGLELALTIAISSHENQLATTLIDFGADIDFAFLDGTTALSSAAYNINSEIIRYLIENEVDINTYDISRVKNPIYELFKSPLSQNNTRSADANYSQKNIKKVYDQLLNRTNPKQIYPDDTDSIALLAIKRGQFEMAEELINYSKVEITKEIIDELFGLVSDYTNILDKESYDLLMLSIVQNIDLDDFYLDTDDTLMEALKYLVKDIENDDDRKRAKVLRRQIKRIYKGKV